MKIQEGSIVPVNLRCGCAQVQVTLLRGEQRVTCPHCGKDTKIIIKVDDNGNVKNLDVYSC